MKLGLEFLASGVQGQVLRLLGEADGGRQGPWESAPSWVAIRKGGELDSFLAEMLEGHQKEKLTLTRGIRGSWPEGSFCFGLERRMLGSPRLTPRVALDFKLVGQTILAANIA